MKESVQVYMQWSGNDDGTSYRKRCFEINHGLVYYPCKGTYKPNTGSYGLSLYSKRSKLLYGIGVSSVSELECGQEGENIERCSYISKPFSLCQRVNAKLLITSTLPQYDIWGSSQLHFPNFPFSLLSTPSQFFDKTSYFNSPLLQIIPAGRLGRPLDHVPPGRA